MMEIFMIATMDSGSPGTSFATTVATQKKDESDVK